MASDSLPATPLILASSSPYRKELLARLGVEFECLAPNIDESRHEDEAAEAYVRRLAQEKATKIGKDHADHLVIGSDQCSLVHNEIVGKPSDRTAAIEQLKSVSGQQIEFLTAVYITHVASSWSRQFVESYYVQFRDLSEKEIERYIDSEKPLNCAGSFKSEGLGITLCKSLQGNDPTALIGLPLIQVGQILREFGLQIP